ncbi:hypothetical protein [Dietzia cercidiphylli]|uniref:Secreted protein n=1 Tax=Dietzia cercidiphylli TaxID=498199 RepID=A0ABP4UX49_9ACTN
MGAPGRIYAAGTATLTAALRTAVTAALAATVTGVVVLSATTAVAQPHAAHPVAAPPGLGPAGTSTVHGDVASTDTMPGRGPGANPAIVGALTGATCSTVFVGTDGMPVALCTSYVGLQPPTPLAPTVKLFHPDTAAVLAEVQLAKGALLGGVYGYLDELDRVVVADGNRKLLAVGHHRDPDGTWRMSVEVLADLSAGVPDGDAVTGLIPAFDGRVWFATSGGVVGTVLPGDDDTVRTLALPAGERITNGLTVRPGGASIITTRALYEVDAAPDGTPVVRWRHGYEVGPARKPGLLAHGSGTTPTYFGPGDSLVAITDDAEHPDLIVLRRADGAEVCRMPAFATSLAPASAAPDGVLIEGPAATENSIIAVSDALVLVNTYGYEYPPFAVDGPAVPASAPYTGGMTRIDVRTDGTGGADGTCSRAWTSLSRTASLPKLTTGDGLIHALAYGPRGVHPALDQGLAQKFGPVDVTSTDVETGREVARSFVGVAPLDEPMELTGTVVSRGEAPSVMWQPTLTRMLRIGPA